MSRLLIGVLGRTVILSMSCVTLAWAQPSFLRPPEPKDGFTSPPVTARVAPELLPAAHLWEIPLTLYGLETGMGPRFKAGGFLFGPSVVADLLWGRTEAGLTVRSYAFSVDFELALRKFDRVRVGFALGLAFNSVVRASMPVTLNEQVTLASVLASADLLRFKSGWSLFVGAGYRVMGRFQAPVLLVGARL